MFSRSVAVLGVFRIKLRTGAYLLFIIFYMYWYKFSLRTGTVDFSDKHFGFRSEL